MASLENLQGKGWFAVSLGGVESSRFLSFAPHNNVTSYSKCLCQPGPGVRPALPSGLLRHASEATTQAGRFPGPAGLVHRWWGLGSDAQQALIWEPLSHSDGSLCSQTGHPVLLWGWCLPDRSTWHTFWKSLHFLGDL